MSVGTLTHCASATLPKLSRPSDAETTFGMVASVGIDIIGSNMKTRRDALIVTSSLALGLGIQAAAPAAFDVVPQALKILVTDGIVMGIVLAMLLNIVLPREAERAPAPAH